jgi:hydroxypyruvate isomerase
MATGTPCECAAQAEERGNTIKGHTTMATPNRRQVITGGATSVLACAATAMLGGKEARGLSGGNTNASAEPASATTPSATKRKGNIHQSVSRWCYKLPLDELCKASAEMGLVGIDLLEAADWDVPGRYGLKCTMGYAGGGEIGKGLNRLENHDAIVAGLTKYVPLAAKAGVPNVITFSGNREGMSDEEGAKNCVIGLKRLSKLMEDHGVVLNMELLNSKVNHKDYMCDHTAWGVKVCEEVGSPNIKLLYDIYHMQIMEGDMIHTITDYHQWIGHYHTGGVPGRYELDDNQEVNWAGVMRGIQATGFKGYVAHEFVPRKTSDPLTCLRQAVDLCDV